MKADMNELEMTQLEQRLRRSTAGHRPPAPETLVDFVETVPVRHRPAGRIALAADRPRVRRSLFGVAAAAAVVVALAGSAALVSLRTGQPGTGASPSAQVWAWQPVEKGVAPLGFKVSKVAHGYIGACGPSDNEVACTSRDGVHWASPADPAILAIDGGDASVSAEQVQKVRGAYVAWVWPPSPKGRLLRSTDGVRWTYMPAPDVSASLTADGATYVWFGALADRYFVVYGYTSPAQGFAMTSTNGVTWTPATSLPDAPEQVASGAAGVYLTGATSPKRTWRSTDGETWTQVGIPEDDLPGSAVRLADGTYLAATLKDGTLVRSTDGLAWHADRGNLVGYVQSLVLVGDRLLAGVYPNPVSESKLETDPLISQSQDGGRTWTPVAGPDGRQLAGSVLTFGDSAGVWDTASGRLSWIGFLGDGTLPSFAPPTATPAATPAPTPTPAPTRLPASLTAEWTWRQTDGTSFYGAFAVPGGYVATCGHTAGNELADASLCSSPDGLHWTVPADPALIAVPAGEPFWPLHVSAIGSVRVAFVLSRPLPTVTEPIASLWRSTDGHHWSKVDEAAFTGRKLSEVAVLGDHFVTVATAADGNSAVLLTSTDGLAWSSAGDIPTVPNGWGANDLGLLISGSGMPAPAGNWATQDGVHWTQMVLPAPVTVLGGSPIRLPDGSFIDIGYEAVGSEIVSSADGVSWQAMPTNLDGIPSELWKVGDRLIMSTRPTANSEPPYTFWQSSDSGKTWQSLPGPDGYPLSGLVGRFDGGLTILVGNDSRVEWIGTLTGQ